MSLYVRERSFLLPPCIHTVATSGHRVMLAIWTCGATSLYMERMPRPRTDRRERKEQSIRIRVTEEQKRVLAEAAEREGLDVSTWLRSLGLRAVSAAPRG